MITNLSHHFQNTFTVPELAHHLGDDTLKSKVIIQFVLRNYPRGHVNLQFQDVSISAARALAESDAMGLLCFNACSHDNQATAAYLLILTQLYKHFFCVSLNAVHLVAFQATRTCLSNSSLGYGCC